MAEKRLSRFGVGPWIAAPSAAYVIAALIADSKWPHVFVLSWLPQSVRLIGGVLMALGILLWLAGALAVMRAYDRDRLVTSGVYALVRHPMYGGWIVLAFPGLALVLRSWPLLVTPFIAYALFTRLVHREDQYLEQRYGQAYLEYRRRVNAVVPIPRFWRKRAKAAAGG